MKPSELFCFKDTKTVQVLIFFLAASNKKFHMPQMQIQIRRDKHGIHNWDAQACTRLLDSLLCITCLLENNAFSLSELRHKSCLTLVYVTSIRDFFCPWNNRALLHYAAARLFIGNNNNNNNNSNNDNNNNNNNNNNINNNRCLYVFISKILYPLILINKFIEKEKGSDTSTA